MGQEQRIESKLSKEVKTFLNQWITSAEEPREPIVQKPRRTIEAGSLRIVRIEQKGKKQEIQEVVNPQIAPFLKQLIVDKDIVTNNFSETIATGLMRATDPILDLQTRKVFNQLMAAEQFKILAKNIITKYPKVAIPCVLDALKTMLSMPENAAKLEKIRKMLS